MIWRTRLAAALLGAAVIAGVGAIGGPQAAAPRLPASGGGEWPHYGGDLGGTRFSSLAQITPANVAKLRPVWRFKVGIPKLPATAWGALETTPLMVDDMLYVCGVTTSSTRSTRRPARAGGPSILRPPPTASISQSAAASAIMAFRTRKAPAPAASTRRRSTSA